MPSHWGHQDNPFPPEPKCIGTCPRDDGPLLIVRAYYGSSRYNTKQMSRLIDSLMEDCEAVGIVTISEKDKGLLLDDWDKRRFVPRSEAHT